MMKAMGYVALAILVVALPGWAGGRAPYGGTLSVCAVSPTGELDPLLVDTPVDTALVALTRTPLCQVAEFSRPTASVLRAGLPPALNPSSVVVLLKKVQLSSSPASALLASVTAIAESGHGVEFSNAPPDLERFLCHPAFSVPLGPFKAARGQFWAADTPEGRPYVDAVTVSQADARAAERLLAQRKVQLIVGSTQADEAPQLFVLVLAFAPSLAAHLRQALDSTVDRADLVKFFVRPPSAPLPTLVPPALGAPAALAPRPPRPAPLSPPRSVTLLYDEAADDERAVAERLQVKLSPLGYRVALKGLPRGVLRTHQREEHELALVGLLVPASPTGAVAMMLSVAGQGSRIAKYFQSVEPEKQGAAWSAELPLWPIATRGVGVTLGPSVQHFSRDALGLPRFDDLFFAQE